MRVTVCRPEEMGPAEIRAWQAMQRDTPSLGSPFLSAEFARAAGRFRPAARVAVLADGPQTVGFFPFERRGLGAGAPLCGLPGTFTAWTLVAGSSALATEVTGATMIIVAQRVATIRHAHQILVLDAGRIVARGTHDELMESSETYREIVLSQLTEQEAAA